VAVTTHDKLNGITWPERAKVLETSYVTEDQRDQATTGTPMGAGSTLTSAQAMSANPPSARPPLTELVPAAEDADRSGSQPQSANTENVTQRKVKGRGFSRENSSLYADVDTTLRRTASCKSVHPKQASIANTNYSP